MSEVKRWDHDSDESSWMNEAPKGEYVLYTDHAEAMREKDAEIAVDERNLAEAMRTIAKQDEEIERLNRWLSQVEDLRQNARKACDRAEAQRDALICAFNAYRSARHYYQANVICGDQKKTEFAAEQMWRADTVLCDAIASAVKGEG